MAHELEKYIVSIPDFPQKGVLFRDVTGIFDSGYDFRLAVDELERLLDGVEFNKIAAPESRGFIFAAAIAVRKSIPFIPVRKPGKLPRKTISQSYELEYGSASLHMHDDAVRKGDKVVIVDDLLATGGTARATAKLIEELGGEVVKIVFPIELDGFNARSGLLSGYDVESIVHYSGT